MEQIEAGHIGDNLAVLYDEMLKEGVLNALLRLAIMKMHILILTHLKQLANG